MPGSSTPQKGHARSRSSVISDEIPVLQGWLTRWGDRSGDPPGSGSWDGTIPDAAMDQGPDTGLAGAYPSLLVARLRVGRVGSVCRGALPSSVKPGLPLAERGSGPAGLRAWVDVGAGASVCPAPLAWQGCMRETGWEPATLLSGGSSSWGPIHAHADTRT